MSDVTLSQEMEALHTCTGISLAALRVMVRAGIERSFLAPSAREAALAELEARFPFSTIGA
jgi:hypothetical protein